MSDDRNIRILVRSLSLCAAVALLALPSTGFAQAGFSYEIKSSVEKGEEKPAVILRATGDVADSEIEFRRSDGKTFTKRIGSAKEGEEVVIPVDQPAGKYSYDVHITGEGTDGSEIDASFEAEMAVVGKLDVWVKKDRAAIAEGKLTLKGSRPIEKVHVTVYNEQNKPVHKGMVEVGGATGNFTIEWPAVEDVGAVRVKAYDVHGFWRGVELEPFWVKIPHDEVRFKFGKAEWEESEVPKLRDSLEKIREAMEKHERKGLEMQLYISGYTDTVGSAKSNRELSRKRARAIGEWFRNNGLDIPVYYQGFGEDVLAVDTPDETKNKQNRRAIYILGNAQPPTSGSIPRSNWRRLD